MPDYKLEGLSTRSFEQLIQAIALKALGPQVMVFGDGPDGGREAIFSGSVRYPPGRKHWNGYGIIQAKFRQEPDSSAKKNADWALAQLRAEFKKFLPKPQPKKRTTHEEDRVCPDYFVFATNLSLSPVAKTGGKDRIRAQLLEYKSSHGLKDFAIWDGDQVQRFLDVYTEIRTAYLAWLVSGDVLAEMMRHLNLAGTDFPSIIRKYLESELLDDQFAKLSQGGYTDAKSIPLSSVFVDLPIKNSVHGEAHLRPRINTRIGRRDTDNDATFLRFFFEQCGSVLKPSYLYKPRDIRSARPATSRIVLIGGPGQGKTTVGQFACQLMRAALLRSSAAVFSMDVAQALDRIDDMGAGLPSIPVRRYPLRVDLKQLAAALAAKDEKRVGSLFDFFVKRISERTNNEMKAADFRLWLRSYPWLLVLDGLDEVPASSNRQQVMQAIRDFVSVEAHESDADLMVLATTRPQGYSDEFEPGLYSHVTLAPLNQEQALSYGARLAAARHPGQRGRIAELTQSLSLATKNAATARLMQSPLQVTIMLALIEGGGQPPEQRWKLFHDYYDVIYRREKERGTPFSDILRRYEPDVHWIHHRVGWLLQQRNAGVGKTNARLTHEQFAEIVDARLQSSGHDAPVERAQLVRQIQTAATDRLVFLVGNTESEIGFEIRSLQEFMASEHFFDGGESCIQETLHAIAPFPYWRNVFLFAAGRIFFQRQELIDSITAICQEMNEQPGDLAQQQICGGSRLSLALLKDGTARNRPASVRVMARCSARTLDLIEEDLAVGMSEILAGDAKDIWLDELSRRLALAPGANFPYQAWILGIQLSGLGGAAHRLLICGSFHGVVSNSGKSLSMLWRKVFLYRTSFGLRSLRARIIILCRCSLASLIASMRARRSLYVRLGFPSCLKSMQVNPNDIHCWWEGNVMQPGLDLLETIRCPGGLRPSLPEKLPKRLFRSGVFLRLFVNSQESPR